jgi:uncharacterized membrane protein YecN with MAPEG domain
MSPFSLATLLIVKLENGNYWMSCLLGIHLAFSSRQVHMTDGLDPTRIGWKLHWDGAGFLLNLFLVWYRLAVRNGPTARFFTAHWFLMSMGSKRSRSNVQA